MIAVGILIIFMGILWGKKMKNEIPPPLPLSHLLVATRLISVARSNAVPC